MGGMRLKEEATISSMYLSTSCFTWNLYNCRS